MVVLLTNNSSADFYCFPTVFKRKAVPKQDDDDKTPAPPLFQENVFIEASRGKYLENLHTEALEGLKMMQQEETNNGVEYQDNESMISRMTAHTDGEGGGFMTDSTIADTTSVISVQSSVSTRSSRSGLTRQESTFRPLNSGKKSEKSKTRRRHRKTVVGIPHHVQRELGLDRVGWTLTPRLDEEQLYNGETSPTTDGLQQAVSQKRANANLQDMKIIHPLNKEQLDQLNASHAGHRDDLALLRCLGPDLSGEQRPRSLAVPWMTTANSLQQEPPSPVMSMSPQAPYMSKIIPNAVLPPSIDVVEISRGRSRNSVRTVSKSSLVLSSPAPSRASSRASTRTTSSKASTITSASRHNPLSVSDSSCWSNSESSETLVSDSSTISSSSTPRQKKSQDGDSSDKNKCTSNGKFAIKGDEVKKEGPFVRSLSVMKPKRAPPPPSRSYSLHNKFKRRSRDLAEVKVITGESSLHTISASGEENENHKSSPMRSKVIDSPGYNADTSSLEDSMGSASFSPLKVHLQAQKAEDAAKVEDHFSKHASPEEQEPLQENKLSKIASPSSGYSSQEATSAQHSKQAHSSSPKHKKGILAKLQRFFPGSTPAPSASPILTRPGAPVPSVDTASVSSSVRTLRELFNIPPPPNVHAPPPPPPEVWVHSKRSIELLLGPPVPDSIQAIIKKNPKDRRQQRQSPSASTEGSVKSLVVERKHKNPTMTVESINGSVGVIETKKVQESGILNAEIHKESSDRLEGNSKVTERNEKVRVSDILNGMLVKAVEKREERLATVKEEAKKTTTQTTEGKTNMDTLTAMSIVRPTKQTTEVASVAAAQVVVSPEMSWPPPPSPMGLGGTDDIDFPLPPPPMFGEEALVIPVCVPQERTIPDGSDSCTTTPVLSVVKTGSVRVTSGAEPQKPSTTPPLNIPPPPPYTAPPPPIQTISTHMTIKVSPPPPKEFSPPPPPKEVSPPPPKMVSPPPPKAFFPPPPKDVFLPPPEVPPPPPKEVPPPPPKEVTPPPPKEVSPVRPKEYSTPQEATPPPVKEAPPPLVTVVSPPPVKEVSPPLVTEVTSPPVKEVSPLLVTVVSPPPVEVEVEEVSPQVVTKVSPLPPEEPLSTEEVSLSSSQENVYPSFEEATPVSILTPPQSIPPPPPLPTQPQSSEQEINPPQENAPSKSETNPVSSNSILSPPQSIPPLPPIQLPHQTEVVPPNTDDPATQEGVPSSPSADSIQKGLENSPTEKAQEPAPSQPVIIPVPPPVPVQGLASIKHQPSPASVENQTPELTSAPVVQEEPTPIVTPSILEMVKLRSVNSSPEPPKAQDEPEAEVTMRNQPPSNEVPTLSSSGEPPQKPIRRSLIMTSPAPTSPPAVVTSQPAPHKSQSLVIPPVSSSMVLSPTKKSPTTTISPSMNLQEAIRLRTAARSQGSATARLSLHSPTSPVDLRNSPSSTASFIFSKSNKKMVIETNPAPGTKTTIQKNLEVSSATKVVSEAELVKKEVKVPPPVAKKPKKKATEIETSEGTEQTAGQEALKENIMDAAEKTNGTAGTVEGGGTPST